MTWNFFRLAALRATSERQWGTRFTRLNKEATSLNCRPNPKLAGDYGGEGGIRTPDSLATMADFESAAFNRALPPLRAGKPLIANGFCGLMPSRSIIPNGCGSECEATFLRGPHLRTTAYSHKPCGMSLDELPSHDSPIPSAFAASHYYSKTLGPVASWSP